MSGIRNSTKCLSLLSEILLATNLPPAAAIDGELPANRAPAISRIAACLTPEELIELENLAHSHHVLMRTFPRLQQFLKLEGNSQSAEWAEAVIAKEHTRVQNALSFLDPICTALSAAGNVVVIKSLDHWPDLGSDLDLFTDAPSQHVVAIMRRAFGAEPARQSWGDRLANKWNFVVPELPELVEVHVGRLGQTGEQIATAKSLVVCAQSREISGYTFRVAAPEERLLISTLQRMYRHFYIRLCDIVDNAKLIESEVIDYAYLRMLAVTAGLWEGLATYLKIVADYVRLFTCATLPLPSQVENGAMFGGEEVFFRKPYIRIPLLPHAARLYASELKRLLLNGEIANSLRLSLLPGLATAAALEFRWTGSDKGIW